MKQIYSALSAIVFMAVACQDAKNSQVFVIKPDSIFYVEQGQTYLLKTKKDSLCIYYKGWTYKASYKVDKGILIMKDEDRENKLIKVK